VKASNKFEECLDKGLLRKVQPSMESCMESLKMAQDWLEESRKNFESGSLRSAYSSAYMCYFHSARAILFKDGYREKSHYCIGVYLDHLFSINRLEIQWVLAFDNVRNSRHNEQYNFSGPPSKEEVRAVIRDASAFMERMRLLIK
jgi:uncharacterized protein (UPF0332 family)